MFPSVFNLAGSAAIIANATCGDRSSEVYCKLNLDPSLLPSNQDCGICDASERNKAHPISLAIDGQKSTWWQAPSLQFGPDYHFISITVDLKKVSNSIVRRNRVFEQLIRLDEDVHFCINLKIKSRRFNFF